MKFVKFLKWLFQRAAIFYLILWAINVSLVDYDKVRSEFKIRTLNFIRPDFTELIKSAEYYKKIKGKHLKRYIQYYKKIVEFIPGRSDALGMLGYCYYQAGHYKEAAQFYQKAIDLHPPIFWFHYNLGMAHFRQGKFKEAIAAFETAKTKRADTTVKYLHASKVYKQIGDKIKNFKEKTAINIQKGYRDCYIFLILAYHQGKDFAAVEQTAKQALTAKLKDPAFFYYYAGLAAYDLKHYEDAVAYFNNCIKSNPQYIGAFHYLGLSLQAVGRNALAEAVLQKSEELKKAGQKHPPIRGSVYLF